MARANQNTRSQVLETVAEQHDEQQEQQHAGNGNGNVEANRDFGCIPASVDEVEELVLVLRQEEGGRIRVDRVLPNGRGLEFLGKIPAVDFDIDRCLDEWGSGRYRLYGRVDGEAKVRWKRLITVAGKPAAAPALPAFPSWTPPANPPGWPPGYPPPHYFYQPQQQQPTNNDTAMASVMNLMLTQSKQQSDLLIAMMNRQVEATGRAPHVNELGELLKLAKELAGLKKGGGGDEDESLMGPAIGSFLGTIAQAWKAEAENNRLNAGDRQRAPASTAKANRAAQTIQRSAQPSNQVPAAAGGGEGSGAPPAPTSAPRRAAPAPDPNSVEGKIRKIASLVVITAEDDQRDPSAFAEVTYSILGPELAAAIVEAAAEGEMAPQLIATYPKLESSREFLREIEKELRTIVADAAAEVPPPEPAAAGASEDAAAGQGKEETD